MRWALLFTAAFLSSATVTAPQMPVLGYLGGSGTDDCDGIAADQAGNIYLACHSDSADFPHLPTKSFSRPSDGMDALVVKINLHTGQPVYVTRTGGRNWDAAGGIEVAPDGSVYVLGMTRSPDFPTTPDAVQRRFGGPDRDVFLLKLNPEGKIIYSTLLGGSKNDEATGLAVDHDGTVYIGGVTTSPDFPGERVRRYGAGGQQEAFVARLRPGDPQSLQTVLLGGQGLDHITSLALDGSGHLFATGYTDSSDFPVKNALQAHNSGGVDAFLTKLQVSDWSLLFSTYLGGSKMDGAYAVAVDSLGNSIVSGVTDSDDFVSTMSAFQRHRRGTVDAFVTKLDKDGGRVLWSSYYGGSKGNSDRYEGGSMAVDEAGRVWLVGATNSLDLPTRNPYQPSYGGGDFDGFLAGFSSDGSKLCYGSYLGGSAHDVLEGLSVRHHRIYVSGITASTHLQQRRTQVQPGFGGGPFDAFFADLPMTIDPGCR